MSTSDTIAGLKNGFSTPILLLIYNRPQLTKTLVSIIRDQRPQFLYIAADGPKNNKELDADNCDKARNVALNNIDWDCNVKTLFRDKNLGCGIAVSEAITWFFSCVEEGIILEDDCFPSASFFPFCTELLERYRYNTKISAISGNNFQLIQPMPIQEDYYFSIFPSSWGWASWRRSWMGYDLYMTRWDSIEKNSFLKFLFKERKLHLWWRNQFENFYQGKLVHTWDFQFHFHSMARRQYCVVPKVNLVSNTGNGPDATHFKDLGGPLNNIPTGLLNFPLNHPNDIIRNYEADIFNQYLLFGEIETVSLYKRLKRRLKYMFKLGNNG